MSIKSYVAMGDSFTEGLGDPRCDASIRGWADLVAEQLAIPDGTDESIGAGDKSTAPLHYANLAIRGKLLGQIVDDQLELALAMNPELITFAAGGNDILRPRADMTGLIRLADQVVARMVDRGISVVMFTGADPSEHLPMKRVIRSHGDRFCEGIRQIAQRRGTHLVDLWSEHALRDLRYWDQDRLHLNPVGHHQVAARVLRELGVGFPAAWLQEPAALPVTEHPILDQAEYYRGHVLPWVQRRLSGRSSGDDMAAKRPELSPLVSFTGPDTKTC